MTVPATGIATSTLTSRYIADIQSRQERRMVAGVFCFVWKRQCRNILYYGLIFPLLAVPISLFFGASAPLPYLLFAGLAALPLLLSGIAGVTLRSLRRFDLLTTLQLFGAVSTLFLVILAISVQAEQVGVFLLVSALASTITLAIALLCIIKLLPIRDAMQPSILLQDRLTRGATRSLSLFVLDCIVWQRSEMLLLAWRGSTANVGFYALASIMSTYVMEFIPTVYSIVLLPLFLRYLPNYRYVNAADAFLKNTCYIACLTIPICLLAMVFCPQIILFCAGSAYLPVVTPLRILLIAAAAGSISTVSLTCLAQTDRRRAQNRLGMAAALLNIVLAFPCIFLWGVTGAAITCAIAQTLSALGSILLCKKTVFNPSGLPVPRTG